MTTDFFVDSETSFQEQYSVQCTIVEKSVRTSMQNIVQKCSCMDVGMVVPRPHTASRYMELRKQCEGNAGYTKMTCKGSPIPIIFFASHWSYQ